MDVEGPGDSADRLAVENELASEFRLIGAHLLRAPLARVVHAWKSFTAHAVNRALARSGPLWAREYFDHAIQDERELEATTGYIGSNPVAAGLVSTPEAWPWSSTSLRRV